MKKITLIYILAVLTISASAQTPQAFKYQQVVRDAAGELLQNQELGIRISIYDSDPGGIIVYQETFSKTTNDFGLMNLEIGNGTVVSGTFSAIDWRSGSKFVGIEVDPAGGTAYVSMGTSQLLSVPFSLHSATSDDDGDWTISGNDVYLSTAGNVGMGTSIPDYKLDVTGDVVADGFRIRRLDGGSETVHKIQSAGGYIQYFNSAGNRGHDFVTNDGVTVESRMRIIGNGNVGIGTSTPSQKLEVNGAVKIGDYTLPSIDGADGQFLKTNGSGSVSWSDDNTLTYWTENSGSVFRSTGNVGIGTSTPANKLDIQAGARTGTHPTGLPLYVTGGIDADTNGIEFRHSNATQGIGIGYNTIYAAGSNPDQDLTLKAKGNSKIAFNLGGVERWFMAGSSLNPLNSGGSVFIGVDAGKNDDLSDNYNVGIGSSVLEDNSTGESNTALGFLALENNVSGSKNVAVGGNAMQDNITGSLNTAIGAHAGNRNTAGSGNVFLGYQAGYWETGSNKLYIANSNTSNPLIYGDFSTNQLKVNGDLEVNDGNLYVKGFYGQGTHWYCFHRYQFPYVDIYQASSNYSIRADYNIRAVEFHAVSDQRIKTNCRVSNGVDDLDLINKIEVTEYTHIDTLSKGSAYKKGFIAQQVESIYPEAVSQSKAFVPDIYKFSTNVTQDRNANSMIVTVDGEHKLEAGDKLKFYSEEKEHQQEVLEIISPTQFRIAAIKEHYIQLFIFGKEVNDFRSVDYDQVFTIGISAIQELSRQQKELIKSNEEFNARLAKVESMVEHLSASKSTTMITRKD